MQESEPTRCPFCGAADIRFANTWRAVSGEPQDAANVAELDEYQCQDCGRAFWT